MAGWVLIIGQQERGWLGTDHKATGAWLVGY